MKELKKYHVLNSEINLLLILLFILFNACKSDDVNLILSDKKIISEFKIFNISAEINSLNNTINLSLPENTDITKLSPTITISEKATLEPASNTEQDFTNSITYTVTAEDNSSQKYVVTVEVEKNENVHDFMYDNKKYEIIKEKKTWEEAAQYASKRGGYLAEINTSEENIALFDEAKNNANITLSSTAAADGGGASYIWLGGNDLKEEGTWVWNGNNNSESTQFWQGKADGNAVNALYNNWGNEPDDYQNAQDALALALTQWPVSSGTLGKAAEWNDVSEKNNLYFVIEYDN